MGDSRWPFSFRFGGVGFGLGVGCGVGVGFGKRVSLGGVPGVNQVSSGISSGLSSLPGGVGNIGYTVTDSIRNLGVKGLGGGLGCGVGLGYGFGVGLVLKPSAMEGMMSSIQQFVGNVSSRVGMPLKSPDQQDSAKNGQSGDLTSSSRNLSSLGTDHDSRHPEMGSSSAVSVTKETLDQLSSELAEVQESSNQLMRTALKQQGEIDDLKAENLELKQAICKVNKKAPFCKRL
ncbi:hypothetical protein BSKO_03033 [Bryopsis sp. KO-2023]|nr:hypothetical protein BSKO_03033 [Bryopsis sp. KO-2023]